MAEDRKKYPSSKTILNAFIPGARDVFIRDCAHERNQAPDEWEVMAGRLAADPRALLAAIDDSFPTPDPLEKKFGSDIQLFKIAAPANLSRELVGIGAAPLYSIL